MILIDDKLSNKYFKIKGKDFYFKTGNCEADCFSATTNCEILDYSGFLRNFSDTIIIKNTIYIKIGYGFQADFEEITSDVFYKNLANRITEFIVKANLGPQHDMIELNFNATEERRYLYRKIKIPLIIKEIIL